MAEVYMAGDVRNGTTFELDNSVYKVVEFQHVKPGKGAAFVRTKLKNVITVEEPCPKCGGKVQVRKTKRKRNYYICENNPTSCDYISWNKPKKGEVCTEESKEKIEKEIKVRKTKKAKKK